MTPELDKIYVGDALTVVRDWPDGFVHCCVTSPPYWGLRSYIADDDPEKALELGLEFTPEEYVAKMVEVFRGVRRVLRPDGTLWLNMGGGYIGGGREDNAGGKQATNRGSLHGPAPIPANLKPKDLDGVPWRLAFALQADGWWLRQDIIWQKPNPMPESVTDRCTKSHEYIFLLTKKPSYFYDAHAVAEPLASDPRGWGRHSKKDPGARAVNPRPMFGPDRGGRDGTDFGNGKTRNRRSVWTVSSRAFHGAHFATFPPKLIEPCILAGTSARGACPECGAPWERIVEKSGGATGGWRSTCQCPESDAAPCIVLDPFMGAGTTGLVAWAHNRKYLGIELNPEYAAMARERIASGGKWKPAKDEHLPLFDGAENAEKTKDEEELCGG